MFPFQNKNNKPEKENEKLKSFSEKPSIKKTVGKNTPYDIFYLFTANIIKQETLFVR